MDDGMGQVVVVVVVVVELWMSEGLPLVMEIQGLWAYTIYTMGLWVNMD